MPNIHIQTAATNVRRAVDDIKLRQQQIKNNTNQHVSEMQKRIDKINFEQNQLNKLRYKTDDASAQTGYRMANEKLERERKDLEKAITDQKTESDKQSSQLDSQMREFGSLADNLASRA